MYFQYVWDPPTFLKTKFLNVNPKLVLAERPSEIKRAPYIVEDQCELQNVPRAFQNIQCNEVRCIAEISVSHYCCTIQE